MGTLGLVALLAAWSIAWPVTVLVLGLPPAIAFAAWLGGVVVGGGLAWWARDPRRRSDPVSRVEARRLARERFEADRLRRAREGRDATPQHLSRLADERAEARVRELVERRKPEAAGDPEA